MPTKKILFICTGNSCRSPMAAGILSKMLGGKGDFEIISAGITAIEGLPASPYAVKLLKEMGIDISRHSTKKLTGNMVKDAGLIVVMTENHKKMVLERHPEARGKIHLLKDFDETGNARGRDIEDPVSQPEEAYVRCIEQMRNPLNNLTIRLIKGEI